VFKTQINESESRKFSTRVADEACKCRIRCSEASIEISQGDAKLGRLNECTPGRPGRSEFRNCNARLENELFRHGGS
jgi:hypothetical protein